MCAEVLIDQPRGNGIKEPPRSIRNTATVAIPVREYTENIAICRTRGFGSVDVCGGIPCFVMLNIEFYIGKLFLWPTLQIGGCLDLNPLTTIKQIAAVPLDTGAVDYTEGATYHVLGEYRAVPVRGHQNTPKTRNLQTYSQRYPGLVRQDG